MELLFAIILPSWVVSELFWAFVPFGTFVWWFGFIFIETLYYLSILGNSFIMGMPTQYVLQWMPVN